jgi:hypothetical protein
MQEYCHRCHGELPHAAAGNKQSSDDAMLFCPRCSAPQILLPEHMRVEPAVIAGTTGTMPPPLPADHPGGRGQIDWRVALPAAGAIALVAAALRIAGLKLEVVSIVWFFWMLAGANLALGVYAKRRPAAWMDARAGLRIGLVTGMLMCGAMALAGAATGVVERYGLRGMARFDDARAKDRVAGQEMVQAWMKDHELDADMQKNYAESMNSPLAKSPEMLAGVGLLEFGFEALVLMFISAGTGAVNGMMRGARIARQRRQG